MKSLFQKKTLSLQYRMEPKIKGTDLYSIKYIITKKNMFLNFKKYVNVITIANINLKKYMMELRERKESY